jgi:hypothetical protein
MKQNYKYDPEDLESLLLHKQFHELYPEEKEFVLRHIETPEEYESMRQTLFELRDAASQGDWLQPDTSIKKALLAEFSSERKSAFRVWLNSLFAWPDVRWYRQPVLQLAMIVLVITSGVWLLVGSEEQQQLIAEVDTRPSEEPIASTASQDTAKKEDNVFAENKVLQEFPVVPEPVKVTPAPSTKYLESIESKELTASELAMAESAVSDYNYEEENLKAVEPTSAAPPMIASKESIGQIRNADMNLEKDVFTKSNKKSIATIANSKPVSEVKDLFAFLYTAP